MKKYKCVIFDIDGTILNTERMNIIPLMRLIKEEKGIDMSYEELIFITSMAGKEALKVLGFEDIETSYSKWVNYVNTMEERATLYEGMDKVIEAIYSKGIVCGVVSSKTKAQYEIDFIPTGLHRYISHLVLAEDTINHKPHPEPLEKFLENVNISPMEAIYIGDTLSDYKCASAVGMDFALALWGARNKEGIEAQYELKEPEDLIKII